MTSFIGGSIKHKASKGALMILNDGQPSAENSPLCTIKVRTVFDVVTCPQCGYKQADYKYDRCTDEETTACLRCGYYDLREAKTSKSEGNNMTDLSTTPAPDASESDLGNTY